MTLFKASPEDWECIDWSAKQGDYIPRALIELKQRLKALEDNSNELNVSTHFCFEAIIRRLEALEAANMAERLEREADRG